MKGEAAENPCTCYTDMCQFVTSGKSFTDMYVNEKAWSLSKIGHMVIATKNNHIRVVKVD